MQINTKPIGIIFIVISILLTMCKNKCPNNYNSKQDIISCIHEIQERNKELVSQYYKNLSNGNTEWMKAFYAKNHLFHFSLKPEPLTKEMHINLANSVLASFPDWAMIVEDMVAEGDKVVARGFISATHTGTAFNGIPASGVKIKIPFISIIKINEEGKNIEEWEAFHTYAFIQQISSSKRERPNE